MTPVPRPLTRKAFTLLEMLIVIGIITLLAAILIPVVSQVRTRAAVATTQGEMMRLMGACQTYFHDWNAYPGPLSEPMLVGASAQVDCGITVDPQATQKPSGFDSKKITSSENLVLGLLGLLSPVPGYNAGVYYGPPPPKHDVMSLSYTHPASYHYLDFLPDELPVPSGMAGADYYAYGASSGIFQADWNPSNDPNKPPNNGEAVSDSGVPEFMDHIPNPMPILYLRAVSGVTAIVGVNGQDPVDKTKPATYNLSQVLPYGFVHIKTDDFPLPTGYTAPPGADPLWSSYFMNPGVIGEARGKNSFILIDAGPDRLFGTKDDIIVTP